MVSPARACQEDKPSPWGYAPSMTAIHLVLVQPEIPWNTGNIGRTCLAVGAKLHLIEPLGFSLDGKQVRRAGLDYWEQVMPKVWPNWEAFAAGMPDLGDLFFFTAEAPRDLWEAPFGDQTVLIFGRESVGLSSDLRERYQDRCYRIPMESRHLRSLNLSSAAAVALYEAKRRATAATRIGG